MEEIGIYHPIYLDSLVIDSILEFDLYAKMPNEKFVLFRGRNTGFSFQHRDSLLCNGIETLFVSEQDQGEYGKYIEQNIGKLMADPRLPNEKKTELLYSVSKGVLLDAFSNPRSGDIVHRTEDVMPHMVDMIRRGKESVHGLISIMSYDYYTFTHSINVCVFSVALANQLGVASQEELQDLAVGTLLHDIGKSEIPKEILNKTGPLTHDEMEVMKSHVERGEKILSEKDGMTAARMLPVLLHHERINGTGYPRRLNAEQIHVHGKIAAIADCFDAMTTNRPYMRAKTAFEAIELMKGKLQGSFDEALLESFIMLLGKAR